MLKVMISYNMQPGREQECQEYLIQKMAPGLEKLGFRFSDVWFTVWGKSPQILGGGMVKDADEAQRIFFSDAWGTMKRDMERITSNFNMKVVHARTEALR